MNQELQDKNKLLQELLNIKNEKETVNTRKTFTEVVTEVKQKPKKIPKIIIKTNTSEQAEVKNSNQTSGK